MQDYLKALDMLSVNDDKLTIQKQVAELTEKSKDRRTQTCIIKGKLSEKEIEIEELRHNDKVKEDALATLSDQVMKLMVEVQELKKQNK